MQTSNQAAEDLDPQCPRTVDAFPICAQLIEDTLMERVNEQIVMHHYDGMRIPCGLHHARQIFDH